MEWSHRLRRCVSSALVAIAVFAAGGPAHARFYLQEEVKPMWFKVDLNRDGYVTWDEVYAEDPALVEGFSRADHDGDGRLELREFEILLISL